MPKKSSRRPRWKDGAFVCIELKDGSLCFGRLLKSPLIAFYDLKTQEISEVKLINERPILFRIWVMMDALRIWPIIGHIPLDEDLLRSPVFFKQDAITGVFSLYENSTEKPTTLERCAGLERAAVWSASHVIDRLADHYSSRPNKWVESLKPRINQRK